MTTIPKSFFLKTFGARKFSFIPIVTIYLEIGCKSDWLWSRLEPSSRQISTASDVKIHQTWSHVLYWPVLKPRKAKMIESKRFESVMYRIRNKPYLNYETLCFQIVCITIKINRAYSKLLLRATVAPNLLPWVLKKIFH